MTNPADYILSGLRLCSDLPLPELVPAPETLNEAEVILRLGKTPETLEKPVKSGVLYQAAPGRFLLNMPGIARYFVQNGNEILVEPAPDSLAEEVRLFLLGSVWAALLHQRERLALHASGILTPQGAVIFMGMSGSGKSSLAAAFYQRGYPVLGDDTIAIQAGKDQILIYPTFPELRLWPDMLQTLGIPPEEVHFLRPKLQKRALPTPLGFTSTAQPVRAIYLLLNHFEETLKLERFQGMQRFSTLLHHTFREKFLGGLGVRPVHFGQVSQVAQKVPIASLTRPEHPPKFKEMIALIEADLGLTPTPLSPQTAA